MMERERASFVLDDDAESLPRGLNAPAPPMEDEAVLDACTTVASGRVPKGEGEPAGGCASGRSARGALTPPMIRADVTEDAPKI
jgi:hypothetical protein